MRNDLLDLVRALRGRVEVSDETEFAAAKPSLSRAVPSSSGERLQALGREIESCRRCPLGSSRLRAVPGVGSASARVMFIGEGPGFEEDHRGEPFVGKSGQLLDRILASIGLSRAAVFIANIVKCHPMRDPRDPELRGNDRPPSADEIAACRGFLDEQIRAIGPRVLVTLGSVPTRVLLATEEPITRVRGQWRSYAPRGGAPVKLLPTFHPAALLRNPGLKRDVWADMKSLRRELEEIPS